VCDVTALPQALTNGYCLKHRHIQEESKPKPKLDVPIIVHAKHNTPTSIRNEYAKPTKYNPKIELIKLKTTAKVSLMEVYKTVLLLVKLSSTAV